MNVVQRAKSEQEKLSQTRCAICDFRMAARRFCNRRDSFPMCNACTIADFGEVLFELHREYCDDEVYPSDKAVAILAALRAQLDLGAAVEYKD